MTATKELIFLFLKKKLPERILIRDMNAVIQFYIVLDGNFEIKIELSKSIVCQNDNLEALCEYIESNLLLKIKALEKIY